MTIGCYCLTNGISGRQFNATMMAAVLTIIGFSINDTIVIFDRIREDLKLGVRGTFKDIMNKALNQTLSRTLITSGTVFLCVFMAFYIFGGGAINDFAFTFLCRRHHLEHVLTQSTFASALGSLVTGRTAEDRSQRHRRRLANKDETVTARSRTGADAWLQSSQSPGGIG